MKENNPIEFLENFDSLIISSVDGANLPNCSYAPFVKIDEKYYIFTSKMAKHTSNLLTKNYASIMFIEDELECKNSFARKRVTFSVSVTNIQQNDKLYMKVIELFKEKFGEKASLYQHLKDFYLFEFKVLQGLAVFDFGTIYRYKDGKFI